MSSRKPIKKRTRDDNNKDNNKKQKTSKTPPPKLPADPLFLFLFGPDGFIDNKKNIEKPKEEVLCKNPLCNHKTIEEDPTPVNKPTVTKINNITDLIELGKTYHCKKFKEMNGINLRLLCNLVVPLTELQNLVGMKSVKENMVNQILFFLQGFNKNTKCNDCVDCAYNLPCAKNHDDMLHTVITGPPGVGKTELGKILAKVYKEMGILSNGNFRLISRGDLIAKYLGQTTIKTQDIINECLGGVMFIDEAYALGHSEGRDSFSKECLDTLNQNLSEKRDFLCIIAGYKEALETCFFSMNEGLRRRFTFRYDIDGYTADELKEIFLLKVKKSSWALDFIVDPSDTDVVKKNKNKDMAKLSNLFSENKDKFPNFGGDVETLLLNTKICHSKRLVFCDVNKRRMLSINDIENGFKKYLDNRKYKEDPFKNPPPFMYI